MHDLCLGARDVRHRAQIFQVCFTDIGDDGNIRLYHAGEQVDLSQVFHAHLYHGNLIVV